MSKAQLSRNETAMRGYFISETVFILNVGTDDRVSETRNRECPYAEGDQPVILPA
jgi:hypothetical protein